MISQKDGRENGLEYEEETPQLPRDVFFCRFSHFFFTNKRFSLVFFGVLIIMLLLIWFQRHDEVAIFFLMFFGSLTMILLGCFALLIAYKIEFTKENELLFLKQVVIIRPGLDSRKWDTIAGNLNRVFYQNSREATPYFFYDGESCQSCFRSKFLNPYLKIENQGERGSSNEQHQSSGNGAAHDLNEPPVQRSQKLELEPYIKEAVKAYQESVDDFWNSLMRDESIV
ncbi:hypothetical protein HG535_0D01820 [Zygotorulaspora mrakii]|uniref:Uncharacterized protein n=1 Tax=Zygotorulaspora mrakii TaxID=42260 RepID=A0A7H9B263_ZYGMR|nr:uncharacterized protein HG535_0D01820 [Zygotorulaspora mrakii]QLG72474.1 hypothetical protein HG535_0D01820 [Zygotorulaspora mrakii]